MEPLFPWMNNMVRLICCLLMFGLSCLGANADRQNKIWWIAVGASGAMVLNWISSLIFSTELYW